MESEFLDNTKLIIPDVIIDENTAPLYCKREKFHMLNNKGEPMGYVNINISVAQSCDCFEFIVHSSSKFTTNELGECGMSMISRVRPSLTTMEEKRTEYSIINGQKKSYSVYLAKLRKNFYIANSFDDGKAISLELNVKNRKYRTPIKELYNFITEAANLLVIKNCSINKLFGKLKTRALLINGDICNSALIIDQEKLTLNNVNYNATKVTRLIKVTVSDTTLISETWINNKGHILLHKWNDTNFSMQFDPELDIDHGYTPLVKSWENDLQLASLYLDKLDILKSTYQSYLMDFPQAEQLINDFIMLLLMQKPADVVGFAIDYFCSMAR